MFFSTKMIKFIIKLIIFYFCFIIVFQNCALCQSNQKNNNEIEIGIGTSDFHIRDELVSPFNYRSVGISSLIHYKRINNNSTHNAYITAFYNNLEPNLSKFYAQNLRVGVRYNYMQNIYKSRLLDFFAGGGIYSFLNISNYAEKNPDEINICTISYFLMHSLEIALLIDYAFINDNNISFKLNIPLLNNISRPGYTFTPNENYNIVDFNLFGKTEFAWDSPVLGFTFNYSFHATERTTINITYDFQYSSYDEPRLVKMYMSNFKTGLLFNF